MEAYTSHNTTRLDEKEVIALLKTLPEIEGASLMALLVTMTIVGTRPEIIRLSCLIPKLDALTEHTFVHTGQNSDPALNDVFFTQIYAGITTWSQHNFSRGSDGRNS